MKLSTPVFWAIAAVSVGFGLSSVNPALAETVTESPLSETTEMVPEQPGAVAPEAAPEAADAVAPGEFILLHGTPETLPTEDASTLSILADRINQGMGGRSGSFLPDGMVVRGSNSSLQLGGEL